MVYAFISVLVRLTLHMLVLRRASDAERDFELLALRTPEPLRQLGSGRVLRRDRLHGLISEQNRAA